MKTESIQGICVEPFYSGSHKYWADNYIARSGIEWELYTLPGRHWKWRMYGAALPLAEQVNAFDKAVDVILVSDMMDVALFKALLKPSLAKVPIIIYFHENQLTYPWSDTDEDKALKRDHHYGFTNISSALIANAVVFNSQYHRDSFLEAAKWLLTQMPDHKCLDTIEHIRAKSSVVGVGIDAPKIAIQTAPKLPRIVWNHRWEYDKRPELFFETLENISQEGIVFELVVLGELTTKYPKVFDRARESLAQHIVHFGYAETRSEYLKFLESGTLLPVSSKQDFFGISVVEAIAYGCVPLLPERLAYPEHISKVDFPELFYQTDAEFGVKLKYLLTSNLQKYQNLAIEMQKYDWSVLGLALDKVIFAQANTQES